MSVSMRVALDAMGGDHAPGEIVLGAVLAAREYGLGVYLVGPENAILAELASAWHDLRTFRHGYSCSVPIVSKRNLCNICSTESEESDHGDSYAPTMDDQGG